MERSVYELDRVFLRCTERDAPLLKPFRRFSEDAETRIKSDRGEILLDVMASDCACSKWK